MLDLPIEIDQTDKTPRTAIAEDTTSGVKRISPNTPNLLIVATKLAAGGLAVATPQTITRESDGAFYGGAGSPFDEMVKAAFKAFPNARLTAVAYAEGGGDAKATETVTFTGTATADGAIDLYVNGIFAGTAKVLSGDEAADVSASVVAVIAGATAFLPVACAQGADPDENKSIFTSKTKGVVGNGQVIRLVQRGADGITYAHSVTGGKLAAGTGAPSIATALAGCAGKAYQKIALDRCDSTAVGELADFAEAQGLAEIGHGQMGVVNVNASLATATTLAGTVNSKRVTIEWINGSETWFPRIAAACAAIMTSESRATRPYNTLEIPGVDAPPASQWPIRTETKNAYDNGVSPLMINSRENVAFGRVITTRFEDDDGNPDYTLLDVPVQQGLDRVRDVIDEMFTRIYGRSNWADDDPTGTLPPDVATPAKVTDDIMIALRQLQDEGTCQNVESLKGQLLVERDDDTCLFSIPADIVPSMQRKLGKIVLIRSAPVAAAA